MRKFTQIKPKELKTIGNVVKEEVNGILMNVRYIPEGVFIHNNPLEQMTSTSTLIKNIEYEKPLWD